MFAVCKKLNGEIAKIPVETTEKGGVMTAALRADAIGEGVDSLDFMPGYLDAEAGEPGYFVVPNHAQGCMLVRFKTREDIDYETEGNSMTVFAKKSGDESVLVVVKQMRHDYRTIVGVKNNRYYLFPRFYFDGELPYEDIIIEYHRLDGADYSAMARYYRRLQIESGCVPLKERVRNNPALEKAVNSIAVRIRQAWKPAPSPVLEQTLENEPPMKAAVTFEKVSRLIDKMKAAGIDDAEICLVGWNRKGHDGRWPQAFPVEEALGGETALRELIKKAENRGYNMVCHTNSFDAYRIADNWDENDLLINHDGSYKNNPVAWSGGRAYILCPKQFFNNIDRAQLEKIAELGFKGLHYIDVITVMPIVRCYHKEHPCTTEETTEWYQKTMRHCRELFGGFSSEGPYDYGAKYTDFVLYTTYNLFEDSRQRPALADEIIPFWQLVYHGIILSNPGTETINYGIKEKRNHLKLIEFGGRPVVYYHQKFVDSGAKDSAWLQANDYSLETDDLTDKAVNFTAEVYREYKALRRLQYEFMESHQKLRDGVYEITYSDNTVITVDYNTESYTVSKQ